MQGCNLSARRFLSKGQRWGGACCLIFLIPLENQCDKSRGYGGGAPKYRLLCLPVWLQGKGSINWTKLRIK